MFPIINIYSLRSHATPFPECLADAGVHCRCSHRGGRGEALRGLLISVCQWNRQLTVAPIYKLLKLASKLAFNKENVSKYQ